MARTASGDAADEQQTSRAIPTRASVPRNLVLQHVRGVPIGMGEVVLWRKQPFANAIVAVCGLHGVGVLLDDLRAVVHFHSRVSESHGGAYYHLSGIDRWFTQQKLYSCVFSWCVAVLCIVSRRIPCACIVDRISAVVFEHDSDHTKV